MTAYPEIPVDGSPAAEPEPLTTPATTTVPGEEPVGLLDPRTRASDADRDRVAQRLCQHLSDGRLTMEEFTERIEEAYAARSMDELMHAERELPYIRDRESSGLEPGRGRAAEASPTLGQHAAAYVLVHGLLVVLWLVDRLTGGTAGSFWPIWSMLGWGSFLATHALRTLYIRALSGGGARRRPARRRPVSFQPVGRPIRRPIGHRRTAG